MKHYLYRHIRLDKDEPFYIGIGTKKDRQFTLLRAEYDRAYAKHGVNNIWNKIISKTDYKVEILYESNDYEFIKQKEIEFIKLYGRIDLKTGILSNLTDGGDGSTNISEEAKKVLRESKLGNKNPMFGKFGELNHMHGRTGELSPLYGKPCSQERRDRIGKANSGGNHGMAKKVFDTASGKIYLTVREASNTLGINYNTLTQYLKGERKNKTTLIYYTENYE